MEGTQINIHLGKEVPKTFVDELGSCKTLTISQMRGVHSVVYFIDDERTLRNFRNNLVWAIDNILVSNDLARKEDLEHD